MKLFHFIKTPNQSNSTLSSIQSKVNTNTNLSTRNFHKSPPGIIDSRRKNISLATYSQKSPVRNLTRTVWSNFREEGTCQKRSLIRNWNISGYIIWGGLSSFPCLVRETRSTASYVTRNLGNARACWYASSTGTVVLPRFSDWTQYFEEKR